MKRMIRFALVVGCCLLAPAVLAGQGSEVWVPLSAPEQGAEVEITVPRTGTELIEIEIELPGVRLAVEETERGALTRIEIPGLGRIGDTGEPMLPVLRRFVEIPEGAEVTFDVMVLEQTTINLADLGLPRLLYPVQLPRPKCDCDQARAWRFSFTPEAYQGRVAHPPVAATGKKLLGVDRQVTHFTSGYR